ncbi:molybdenum ABC transporter ATP-binding protein [Limimaricola pyoseonensis]|uniref:Molybdate transport system ATP-binding protein n=1 Tax=Limimaricola pyoseonensis TaxID=521013 RepID=A0A1G7DE84_9RHOB|nr:molybdenum ABC transporter ATP-binding protein [Limimaricola pyoseonensis]SDE49749.1 molybdate transport system ATP-binding protein [Limimaricola pyoseonensis]
MIRVEIRKRLGEFALDAAFDAPPGVTALFGKSGSGKTSLINAVAGLLRPDAGHIEIDGTVLFDAERRVDLPTHRRRVGYVFQDARLFPHMSVAKNLAYGGRHDRERVIEMLGIGDLLDRRPAALSGGERQRVAIGRALMADPRLLLLDEPLSALDAERKAEILPWLERLRDEAGLPIFYVSHAASEVARLATTVVVMEKGRVTRAGAVAEVLSDPAAVGTIGAQEAGAVVTARIAGLDRIDGLTELALSGGRIVLPGKLGRIGTHLRLRISAQDVILSRDKPQGLSALNVLQAEVTAVDEGPEGVAVGLACGRDRLLARVTRRSARALRLEPGLPVWAIVKASAVAPQDVGGAV